MELNHEEYMKRCLELAAKGIGHVAPNPMVGCVIVHEGKIIGEGYHKHFGGPHAEVEAINSVQDTSLLSHSTLYVNLEPCCHHGKTPPCTDLIIKHGIPRVVVGILDPNEQMNGKGIEKLIGAGIEIVAGVLEHESRQLNRRFFTYIQKKRPYIILKWAQSADGYIDRKRTMAEMGNQERLTCNESNMLVHTWRSQEQAIIVGTNTALMDNPNLTVRAVEGRNPLRVVIDKELKIPVNYNLFNGQSKTIVFNAQQQSSEKQVEYVVIDFSISIVPQILRYLYQLGISSLIVEGGRELVNTFISENLWDEARIFTAPQKLGSGIKGPNISGGVSSAEKIGLDKLETYISS
jgi:diaminohydroxyphosphoribosylaminopyrimidine deaminase / 5-amino-6-(5-phosphoribosylamino)uracil reductase